MVSKVLEEKKIQVNVRLKHQPTTKIPLMTSTSPKIQSCGALL